MVKRFAACAVLLAGCEYITGSFERNPFSGDPYPILIDNHYGALVIGVNEVGTTEQRTGVLDVLSPLTLIDRGPGLAPRIDLTSLVLEGARTPGGELDLPRALLKDHNVATLHPCDAMTCEVGTGIEPLGFDALVGMDSFGGDALRLHLATSEITILPDIAGDELHRSRSCDAVFPEPFRGGGTLLIGGAEVVFANWRIAIDACIAPSPDPLLVQNARGVDALFVLSTAIGTSMINESTYERMRQLDPVRGLDTPPLDMLPEHTLFLPSGPVVGRLTSLPGLALVGNSSTSPRAPCRQVYASHFLAERDCITGEAECPCTDNTSLDNGCQAPAMVELSASAPISVLVVPDADPTLQALRAELRPNRPEVDGILGTEALHAFELDLDYPHLRLLARCVDPTLCSARPLLVNSEARAYVNGCTQR